MVIALLIKEAHHVYVTDGDGKRYVDFTSQGGLLGLGHNHPFLTQVIVQQALNLSYVHGRYDFETKLEIDNIPITVSRAELVRRLREVLQQVGNFPQIRFAVSGAAAVALALRIARIGCAMTHAPVRESHHLLSGKKPFPKFCFFTYRHVYHGHLGDAQLLTDGRPEFALGSSPGIDVIRFDFPDENLPAAHKKSYIDNIRRLVARVRKKFGWRIGGFVFEPIPANARLPDPDLLRALCEEMRAQRVPLIADEIKICFGRTGKDFGCSHYGIRPDMIVLSKYLGGGRPIGAVGVSESVPLEQLAPGTDWDAGTFIGEPLACAGAIAAIDIAQRERLADNAALLGPHLLSVMRELFSDWEEIVSIRGKGLLVSLEFKNEASRDFFFDVALEEGLLTFPSGKGWGKPYIVLMPPMVIRQEDLDLSFMQFRSVRERLHLGTKTAAVAS
jgi:4-aminobutyrate aminotransferase-like enzyme